MARRPRVRHGVAVAALLASAPAGCGEPPPWQTTSATAPRGRLLEVAPPPTASSPPTGSASASASAGSSASAGPRPRPRPPGAPPACDEGIRASGEPRHDVVRLGLSCGPSDGYSRDLDAIEGALAEGAAPLEVPIGLVAGRCYRLVAAAETTVEDLQVELRSERDVPLATDDEPGPLVVLHRDGAVCATAAGAARAVFRAGRGRGRFAAEVWSRPAARADERSDRGSIDDARGED